MTQIVLDQEGNTGSISGFGGGRGGAPGGMDSHAARRADMTNIKAIGTVFFFIIASISAQRRVITS